jgi:hypothetical protein
MKSDIADHGRQFSEAPEIDVLKDVLNNMQRRVDV